jgi:hypothetical protein
MKSIFHSIPETIEMKANDLPLQKNSISMNATGNDLDKLFRSDDQIKGVILKNKHSIISRHVHFSV